MSWIDRLTNRMVSLAENKINSNEAKGISASTDRKKLNILKDQIKENAK